MGIERGEGMEYVLREFKIKMTKTRNRLSCNVEGLPIRNHKFVLEFRRESREGRLRACSRVRILLGGCSRLETNSMFKLQHPPPVQCPPSTRSDILAVLPSSVDQALIPHDQINFRV